MSAMKWAITNQKAAEPAHLKTQSTILLEQQVEHMLVAVEHELRRSPAGVDELGLIKRLQKPPWRLIGAVQFHDPVQLYPVHFLLFHVLYRLRDMLAETGESVCISPLSIRIEQPVTGTTNGLPGTRDHLRDFYLDLSQYELPGDSVQQMMNDFWAGYRHTVPDDTDTLHAARALGFDSVPDTFSTVKQAFRRRVMQAHPDRGGDTESIQLLNEAFATLKTHFSRTMERI